MTDRIEEVAYWEAKIIEAENLIAIANRHLARLAMNDLAAEFNVMPHLTLLDGGYEPPEVAA